MYPELMSDDTLTSEPNSMFIQVRSEKHYPIEESITYNNSLVFHIGYYDDIISTPILVGITVNDPHIVKTLQVELDYCFTIVKFSSSDDIAIVESLDNYPIYIYRDADDKIVQVVMFEQAFVNR